MKYIIVLCCVVVAIVAEEKYTSKFDHINVDEILENERLFESYLNCVMERGKCTPEGTELKSHIRDALETGCAKCTDRQKEEARKTIKYVRKEKPAVWKEITDKYDPTGKYYKQHEHELN